MLSYGTNASMDSVSFEIEKPLIQDLNIKIDRTKKKSFVKTYKTRDFNFQILMSFKNPLKIRALERKEEIFLFTQRKNSGVKYIFYDKNSEPYLIETILTSDQNSFGGGLSRPPIRRKEIKYKD